MSTVTETRLRLGPEATPPLVPDLQPPRQTLGDMLLNVVATIFVVGFFGAAALMFLVPLGMFVVSLFIDLPPDDSSPAAAHYSSPVDDLAAAHGLDPDEIRQAVEDEQTDADAAYDAENDAKGYRY